MKIKKTTAESITFYADERAVVVYDSFTDTQYVFPNGVSLPEILREVTK